MVRPNTFGAVLDSAGENPVSGATVYVGNDSGFSAPLASAATDAGGNYSLAIAYATPLAKYAKANKTASYNSSTFY